MITLESTDMCTKNSSIYCDIIIVHSNGNSVLMSQDGNDLSGHFLLGGAHATDINSHVPHDNKLNLPKKKSETLWSDEYHVYDLEWKPNQIIVKVDGVEYGQQNVPGLYDIPVSNNYLIINDKYYFKILILILKFHFIFHRYFLSYNRITLF